MTLDVAVNAVMIVMIYVLNGVIVFAVRLNGGELINYERNKNRL